METKRKIMLGYGIILAFGVVLAFGGLLLYIVGLKNKNEADIENLVSRDFESARISKIRCDLRKKYAAQGSCYYPKDWRLMYLEAQDGTHPFWNDARENGILNKRDSSEVVLETKNFAWDKLVCGCWALEENPETGAVICEYPYIKVHGSYIKGYKWRCRKYELVIDIYGELWSKHGFRFGVIDNLWTTETANAFERRLTYKYPDIKDGRILFDGVLDFSLPRPEKTVPSNRKYDPFRPNWEDIRQVDGEDADNVVKGIRVIKNVRHTAASWKQIGESSRTSFGGSNKTDTGCACPKEWFSKGWVRLGSILETKNGRHYTVIDVYSTKNDGKFNNMCIDLYVDKGIKSKSKTRAVDRELRKRFDEGWGSVTVWKY